MNRKEIKPGQIFVANASCPYVWGQQENDPYGSTELENGEVFTIIDCTEFSKSGNLHSHVKVMTANLKFLLMRGYVLTERCVEVDQPLRTKK